MNIKGKSTLEKFENILRFKNYANNSIKTYLYHSQLFLNDFNVDVYHISQNKAINYLINRNYSSIPQQNQFISSIKLLYKYIVGVKLISFNIERPRNEKKLPQIINNEYLLNRINEINNLKHRTIISLAYSTGLRVSEVINLKINCIDSKRMIINIINSKGNKDRIVPLSLNVLILLRKYYKNYKPREYLFNGQNSLQYSSNSCNKIVKRYLGDEFHFHTLRHSCFTRLLETGTDLRMIQKLAGHSSSKTTEIYTHVSTKLLSQINLPI